MLTTPALGKNVKIFFRNNVILHIKERSAKHYASKMYNLMKVSGHLGWVKRSDIEIVQKSTF